MDSELWRDCAGSVRLSQSDNDNGKHRHNLYCPFDRASRRNSHSYCNIHYRSNEIVERNSHDSACLPPWQPYLCQRYSGELLHADAWINAYH